MTIIVRQARLRDLDAIQTFIKEAYGSLAQFKDERRWKWQFVTNPFAELKDDYVPVWIAVDGARVVGQIAVQRAPLYSKGVQYSAGWIVDVIILPSYRGYGLGHRLYSAVAESGLVLITLTMAAATRRMAEKLGAITLPPVYSWSTWCAPTAQDIRRYLVSRTQHRPNWGKAVTFVNSLRVPVTLAAAAKARNILGSSGSSTSVLRSFEFESVNEFNDSVDVVWRTRPQEFSGVPRTSLFLNWRYGKCPDLTYHKFLVKSSGHIVGYLVIRGTRPEELSEGIISDALVINDDPEIWKSVYSFAKNFFGDGVASLQALTSSVAGAQALQRLGFVRRKRYEATIVCMNSKVLGELSSATNWLFSLGDHDLDQVNLA